MRGSNPGLRGGRRECYQSATMAPFQLVEGQIKSYKDTNILSHKTDKLHVTVPFFMHSTAILSYAQISEQKGMNQFESDSVANSWDKKQKLHT